ncbi:MAG: class I SAM-dependent methyltransferase, partial [bacterium]
SLLASRAKNVVGMDVSVLTLRVAKSRCTGLQTAGADARCLPFVDGAFDVIVSNSTLDHFETPDEIIASLRELRRVLRDGGQLIITLDNLANPIIALRNALPFRLLHRLGIVPYYVGPTFGAGRLKSALEELQFEIVEVTSVIHFPRVIAVALTNILEKYAPARHQKIFLRFLLAFERLSKWPTQFFTGHFVAAQAIKRS